MQPQNVIKNKTSASVKKLVQAKLPFKRVDTEFSPNYSQIKTLKDYTIDDNGKRKLCYMSDEEHFTLSTPNNVEEENLTNTVKTVNNSNNVNEMVTLGDSTEEEEQTIVDDASPKIQIKFSWNNKRNNRKRKSNESTPVSPKCDMQQQKKSKLDIDVDSTVVNTAANEIKNNNTGEEISTVQIHEDDVVEIIENEGLCSNLVANNESIGSAKSVGVDNVEDDNGDISSIIIPSDEEVKDDSTVMANNSLLDSSSGIKDRDKNALMSKSSKLSAQRMKARKEKELQLQERRKQKQLIKEEKELIKKREREERDNVKRKEREEKEQKRLAELTARNEEKRRRNEIKEEEWRKKEEERKRKEQEKEESELKKKKAVEAFTKFFLPKTHTNNLKHQLSITERTEVGSESNFAFKPFQIKEDMKLAPVQRKNFTMEARTHLDNILYITIENEVNNKNALYLTELKDGKFLPVKWTKSFKDTTNDDVIIIEDEFDQIGEPILEEAASNKREVMRVKFYKFYENRRPPYYGTWRKKSAVITARKPFTKDTNFFDYTIDSDDEWEEEEPGESLDGSEDDKDSQDDDYEVDNEWFVPHGHLSEDELHDRDDLCGLEETENISKAQKAKEQLLQQDFAKEMAKKTRKIKPRLIGCIWADENGNPPENCPKILLDNLEIRSMLCSEPLIIEEVQHCHSLNTTNETVEKIHEKLRTVPLTNELIKKLVYLVHGNKHSKNFLVNEFIAHVEKTEDAVKTGVMRGPLKSMVRDKIHEIAQWKVIDKIDDISVDTSLNANSGDNGENYIKKKGKKKKKLCWVVGDDILNKLGLKNLALKNTWIYTLTPRSNELQTQGQNEITIMKVEEPKSEMKKCSANQDNIQQNTSYVKIEQISGPIVKPCSNSILTVKPSDGELTIKVASKTKLISHYLNISSTSKY